MKVTVALCFLAALTGSAFAQAPAGAPSEADVLNFALNLEYLEAEFYSCAANGVPIPDELRGGGPPSEGCVKAQLTGDAQEIAEEIAADEVAHVRLLRTALGANAAPIPQLNIGTAFAAAADAAAAAAGLPTPLSPPFSPYLNDLFFYHGAFIFEDVGVTAYLGGAGFLTTPQYLETAAQILAVEAYHAGIIRTQLFTQRATVIPYNVTVGDFITAISNLRGSVGGGADESIVTDGPNGETASLVPADADALAFVRTPAEVLAIVTLGTPPAGGFFPSGLTGTIGAAAAPTGSA